MKDIHFGSLNGRSLCVRFVLPLSMQRYDPCRGFVPSWRILSPLAWLRGLRGWKPVCVSLNTWRNSTNRCYCPDGTSAFLRAVFAGVGVLVWYSHYRGRVPCVCDEAIAALDIEADC